MIQKFHKLFHSFLMIPIVLVLTIFAIRQGFSAEKKFFVRVKKEDTVSNILYSLNLGLIYGKGGLIEQTLKLNPQKKDYNGNRIFPDEFIWLPINSPEEIKSNATVLESGEVLLNSTNVPINERIISSDKPTPDDKGPISEPAKNSIAEMAYGDFKPYSNLAVLPQLRYYRFGATDSFTHGTGTVYSDLSPGLAAYWNIFLSEKFSTSLSFDYSKIKILPLKSKSLDSSSETLTSVDFSLNYHFFSWLRFGAVGGQTQSLFLRFATPTEATMEKTNLSNLGGIAEIDFFSKKNLKGTLHGEWRKTSSTKADDITVKAGNMKAVSLLLSQTLKSFTLTGGISYQVQNYDTSISEVENTSLTYILGAGWRIE